MALLGYYKETEASWKSLEAKDMLVPVVVVELADPESRASLPKSLPYCCHLLADEEDDNEEQEHAGKGLPDVLSGPQRQSGAGEGGGSGRLETILCQSRSYKATAAPPNPNPLAAMI